MTDEDRKGLKVGDVVMVRHHDGTERMHVVEWEPWALGHGRLILGLSGVSSGYALDRVVRKVEATAVEAKYGRIIATKKSFHPDEPVFLLRATDPLAVKMVREYAERCIVLGCDATHVADAFAHAHRIEDWQEANPHLVKKRPD